MKVLVLYEELATYFLTALNHLAEEYKADVLVFTKRINPVAPFEFKNYHTAVRIEERENLSVEELINRIRAFDPDITYLSGWIYKPYLKAIKASRLKNVVIGFDNQYNGSLRQWLGAAYFRIRLKPYIKAAFVPGKKQRRFAGLLGFTRNAIAEGVYCCDLNTFNAYYEGVKEEKRVKLPHRFLFVGRYAPEKGIKELWQAFEELAQDPSFNWELWCLGKGELQAYGHPKIKHLGFRQPDNLKDVIKQTSVFILPSHFEPWGVVVQEYAAAGLPVVTTQAVGASELFVNPGKTGFILKTASVEELKQVLKTIANLPDDDVRKMGEASQKLAQCITPQIWCQRFIQLANER
ncbi:MAG: glycosyltransferase family 4 protein [Sediminibacterium sp.]|nr:glycosyltransferase family 4 protein [Sediminibacterium sp.]